MPFALRPALLVPLLCALLLGGCDMLGIESPEKVAAVKEADGKATGSACRHAARAIEDCYQLNPKSPRAAVFAGWREMDEYMRENKIEAVAPNPVQQSAKLAKPAKSADAEAEAPEPSASEAKPAAKPKRSS